MAWLASLSTANLAFQNAFVSAISMQIRLVYFFVKLFFSEKKRRDLHPNPASQNNFKQVG